MKKLTILGLALFLSLESLGQTTFESLGSLLAYAEKKSISLKTNDVAYLQAKKARIAAMIGILDPQVNSNLSYINNTQLPVSVFPAEIFGGEPGTFTQVEAGVQYNTSAIGNVDIKLLNLSGWENLKLANINLELTEASNKQGLKALYENIASSYHNILTLQEQLRSAKQNMAIADTLHQIAHQKFELGLVKPQDVNDTRANQLNISENKRQIEYLLKQNYISLKILCDIPDEEVIKINQEPCDGDYKDQVQVDYNALNYYQYVLKENYAKSSYAQSKKSMLPTFSFVANQSYQLYNSEFSVFEGDWISSNYVGFRLSFNLPSANSIVNRSNAKYSYLMAQNETEQARIQADLDQSQLLNEYHKSLSQYHAHREIYELRMDSYQKNQNLYEEGVLSLDQTLNSYDAMVNAGYNADASNVSVLHAISKININNSIK